MQKRIIVLGSKYLGDNELNCNVEKIQRLEVFVMIMHMFPKSQFVEGFINFIYENFDSKEHMFVLYTNAKFEVSPKLYELDNVVDYDEKNIFWLYKSIKKADKLFLHNLSVNIYELFMLAFFPGLLKKCIWLIWGGDLYCYRNQRKGLIERAIESARRRVIKHVSVIASLTEGDYSLAQQWYEVDKKHIRLNYYIGNEAKVLYELVNEKYNDSSTTNIIVGNSATVTNNHIEVFEKIKHYSEQDICIYAPLSYGDREYGRLVEDVGRRIFGKKFVALNTYMSHAEYFSLLNRMDIAIFNNDRQQAIGNIMALALLGKKVYLKKDTSMWNEWVTQGKFLFHKVDEIDSNFSNFVQINQEEIENNRQAAHDYYDVNQRISEWKQAFEMDL